MKDAFQELVDSLKKNLEKCPWGKELTVEKIMKEVASEHDELQEAFAKKDYVNFKEELGDLLMDLIHTTLVAEKEGYFKAKDVFAEAAQKLQRRKPWVFGDEKIETVEDAVKRWNEIKAEEKK